MYCRMVLVGGDLGMVVHIGISACDASKAATPAHAPAVAAWYWVMKMSLFCWGQGQMIGSD